MRTFRLSKPSPALAVSFAALMIALGGTSYAAFSLPKNSVGSKQLKKNAVTTRKIKNGAVTAPKINPAGLTVPNASHANNADHATNADHANSATNATNATNANHASTADAANGLPALTFTPLTLENGWTGGPFATRQPAVAKDAQGIVHLKGAIGSGTTAVAFVLPAEDRPSAFTYLHVDMCNATSGRIIINPTSGQTSVQAESSFSNAQCFTSLEGVSFPAG